MSTDKGLLVIGSGVLQPRQDGNYYGKAPVVGYIHGLRQYFVHVTWATSVDVGDPILDTPLDQTRVNLCIVEKGRCNLYNNYQKLIKAVSPNSFVLIFMPNPWLVAPALLLKRKGHPLFVYLASDYYQHCQRTVSSRGLLYSLIYRYSNEILISKSDGVIARGKKLRRYAQQYNSTTIETIPLGLRALPDAKRQAPPLSSNVVRLLFVGKLVRSKGLATLLTALCLLKSYPLEGYSIFCSIVGQGPDEDYFREFADECGVDGLLTWAGYVDDMNRLGDIYCSSDILVVPSTLDYPEGVPRVVDEAIGHGLLVVATAVGGISEEFANMVALVKPEDPDELCEALLKLITDSHYRSSLLDRASEHRMKRLSDKLPSQQHAEFMLQHIQ